MARKKTKKKTSSEPLLNPDITRSIYGIAALVVATFFTLAGFSLAGPLGDVLFTFLSKLFGVGYALIPVSCALVALSLFQAVEHELGIAKILGAILFFASGLAFIETLFPASGGLVGALFAAPLLFAVDRIATVIILFALLVASLIIVLEVHPLEAFPTLMRLFERDEEEDEDELEELEERAIARELARAQKTAEEREEEDKEEEAEEQKEKKANILDFTKRGKEAVEEAFTVSSVASGVYTPPPLSLLGKDKGKPSVGDVKVSANSIKRTLQNFGITVEMDEVSIGPTVTQYAMKPAEGVRLGKIVSLQSNLELALAASPIRIEAPIPGKSLVGIEVPNTVKSTLGLGSVVSDKIFQNSEKPLLVALGRDIAGKPHYADIAKMPHMLIAGATGAGKSVTVHDLIISLLYRKSPQELRLVLVDPKRVELTLYNGIPHLLTPVITDPKKAILALKWLAKEMDRRYDILEAEQVRDIASYHKNIYEPAKKKAKTDEERENLPEAMPYMVAIIDEMADLMQAYPRELEAAVVRLAQMSRAVGIHLVLSTQRPSVQVITGLIKANIPARLALQVSSQIDSRTILDMGGAEKLLGAGDMLFLSGEMSKPRRIQAPFITEDEVKKVVEYLRGQHESELPDEIDLSGVESDSATFSAALESGEEDDELYEDAKREVIEAGKASTSYLQRKLRIGYGRAARLMDILEERGIIGAADGSRPRDVLVGADDEDEGEYEDNEEEYETDEDEQEDSEADEEYEDDDTEEDER